MNEFEMDEFSDGSEENKVGGNRDGPLHYCDLCFIAFGSQEKRISMGGNTVHPDCANKAKSQKRF